MSCRALILSVGVAMLLNTQVAAQGKDNDNYIRINPSGLSKKISVSRARDDKLYAYYIDRGNQPQNLYVRYQGPKRMRVRLQQKKIGKITDRTIRAKKGFDRIQLLNRKKQRKKYEQCMEISFEGEGEQVEPPEGNAEWNQLCDLYGGDVLDRIAEEYSAAYGTKWTKENACAYLVENFLDQQYFTLEEFLEALNAINGGNVPDQEEIEEATPKSYKRAFFNSKTIYGTLPKDACDSSRAKYLVRIEIDLSRVRASDIRADEEIRLAIRGSEYDGDKRASIKPESEGRYAPAPIVMMNTMGSTCGNGIQVQKWTNKNIRSEQGIEVYSLLSYTDMVLALARVDSVLPAAGKATFQLDDGGSAYGVCFNLSRERQTANGYPK